jgi:hypothetical protein
MNTDASTRASRDAADRYASPAGLRVLWAGLFGAPAAFLLNLQVSYMLVQWACTTGHEWAIHLSNGATLLLALGAGLIAWRAWHGTGRDQPESEPDVLGRSRFLAMLGVFMTPLFALLIVAQWIAVFVFGPCQ